MIGQRFAIASSFLSKLRMNPKMKKQTLSTSSEKVDSSLSGAYRKKKRTQEISKSQAVASPSLSTSLREAMKKKNDADLVLMREVIASKARNTNFIFSPASINAAFTMMAAGSGRSSSNELNAVYSEIATTVFADGKKNGGPKISAINGVWVDQSLPVNHSLKEFFMNVFKATFAQVDFRSKAEQVRRELNKWASDNTNGLIKDLLPPGSITSKTNRVYGNALYFKGAWENKFLKSYTKVQYFKLLDGSNVRVPFMSNKKEQYVAAYDGFKVLRLPYRQGRDKNREFSMYLYLPDGKEDGLDDLMKKMASTPGFVDEHIPRKNVKVGEFRVPKFKISFGFSVSRDFSSLELDEAELYHKACVEMDEEGTEAAAVSAMIKMSYQRRIDFVADHPFLFLIREDRTGTVLFAGQIFDPSKS